MGIFTRMSNMVKGKVNSALDEMENPIELLDLKIKQLEEKLSKAKMDSAQVIGNAKGLEKRVKEAEAKAADFEDKVKLAMSKGNEDLAKKALAKKLEYDKQAQTLQTTLTTSKAQADALKNSLKSLQAELDKTRQYRDEAAARYSTAQASQKVNEIVANVQTSDNSINMDSIEKKIQRAESQADGLGQLAQMDSLEDEFAALEETNLDFELEKYRQ